MVQHAYGGQGEGLGGDSTVQAPLTHDFAFRSNLRSSSLVLLSTLVVSCRHDRQKRGKQRRLLRRE
jgi:hypothetical protein